MDFNLYQKNDKTILVELINDKEEPLDLTGAVLKFVVENVNKEEVIVKENIDISIVNAVNGECQLKLTTEDTDLPIGKYDYELMVIDSGEDRMTGLQGELTILKSIVD